jgi:hypothetical protein
MNFSLKTFFIIFYTYFQHSIFTLAQEQTQKQWAQEYIGLDLVKKDLHLVKKIKERHRPIPIAVLDATSEHIASLKPFLAPHPLILTIKSGDDHPGDHIIYVSQLIFDQNIGSSINAHLSLISMLDDNGEKRIEQLKHFSESTIPLANASINYATTPIPLLKEAFSLLSKTNPQFFVLASGNYHPCTSIEEQAVLDSSSVLTIGNLLPDGLVDPTSVQGQHVVLLVPSGDSLLTKDHEGKEILFGGTSGAAPLVTGVISNVLSLIPDINHQELNLLLQKTSIPTLIQKMGSSQNGWGLINSYKILQVSERIAEQLKKGHKRENIFNDLSFYNFEKESTQAYEDYQQNHQFDSLKRSFYLNPTLALSRRVSEAYHNIGFNNHAKFYQSLSFDAKKDLLDIFYFLMNSQSESDSYYSKNWHTTGRDGVIMIDRLNDPHHSLLTLLLEKLKEDILSHQDDQTLIQTSRLLSFISQDIPIIEDLYDLIIGKISDQSLGEVFQSVFQDPGPRRLHYIEHRKKILVQKNQERIQQVSPIHNNFPYGLEKYFSIP